MNHKVTVVVSSLLLLFSQTPVLSQSSFANTTLASTPTAQESNPSSADAPMKRRSAGTRFMDVQYPDIENSNPNLYYPDAWKQGLDSSISTGLQEYQQGNLTAALENFNRVEITLALDNDLFSIALFNTTIENIPNLSATNLPDRNSSDPTPLPNPQDIEQYAAIANATGLIYRDLAEWEKSEEYFNKALSAFATIDNNIGRSIALTNLGTNYRQLEQPQEALNYYHRALEFSPTNNDRQDRKYLFNQIALAYYESGDKEKSLNYFQQVLTIAKEEDNALNKGIAFNNIGEVYRSLGQKSAARQNYMLALENLSDSDLITTVEKNIVSNSFEDESSRSIIGINDGTGLSVSGQLGVQNSSSNQNTVIDNSDSFSNEIDFTCGEVDGVPTTIASTTRGDISFVSWNSDFFSSTGYSLQTRCETVATRLKTGIQNGLKYLTTGTQNGMNVICMTSTTEEKCEQVLLTLKPEDDPQQTLQALFNNRQTANSSEALSETNVGSRKSIDLDQYFKTAPTINSNNSDNDNSSDVF